MPNQPRPDQPSLDKTELTLPNQASPDPPNHARQSHKRKCRLHRGKFNRKEGETMPHHIGFTLADDSIITQEKVRLGEKL